MHSSIPRNITREIQFCKRNTSALRMSLMNTINNAMIRRTCDNTARSPTRLHRPHRVLIRCHREVNRQRVQQEDTHLIYITWLWIAIWHIILSLTGVHVLHTSAYFNRHSLRITHSHQNNINARFFNVNIHTNHLFRVNNPLKCKLTNFCQILLHVRSKWYDLFVRLQGIRLNKRIEIGYSTTEIRDDMMIKVKQLTILVAPCLRCSKVPLPANTISTSCVYLLVIEGSWYQKYYYDKVCCHTSILV